MTDLIHDELIEREVDGQNTPADSARLAALLDARPELRGRLESLRRVSVALARAERLEPPPRMSEDVMAAVRRVRPREAGSGWLESLRSLFTPRLALASAFTFVVGLAAGAVVTRASWLASHDTAGLSGTTLPGPRMARAIARPHVLSADGVRAEASVTAADGRVVLELTVQAERDVPILVESRGLEARAFSAWADGPSAKDASFATDVVLRGNGVRMVQPTGRGRYTLTFARAKSGGGGSTDLTIRLGDGPGGSFVIGKDAS